MVRSESIWLKAWATNLSIEQDEPHSDSQKSVFFTLIKGYNEVLGLKTLFQRPKQSQIEYFQINKLSP